MKKVDVILKDYVSKLTIENLKFLYIRLNERIGPDLSEAVEFLSMSGEMDKWMMTAEGHDEFFDMTDLVQEYVERELKKRAPELITV
jgi:hypothetical protein